MKIGAQAKTPGNGYDSAHFLLAWYTSWGGGLKMLGHGRSVVAMHTSVTEPVCSLGYGRGSAFARSLQEVKRLGRQLTETD